ncbi:hypothetical protein [Arthrobacter sp. SW1]|uniref:hypothetical protein n=1 Tax=Arthrobacter sp. SW1 TaxID=1920889 RepID=UPI00111315A5|nr:hypothetical protein [Arthrobacter sp. SW1]
MTHNVMFPDFSGFQVEIPGAAASAEPRKHAGSSPAEYLEFWPDAPVREHPQPDEESAWRTSAALPF